MSYCNLKLGIVTPSYNQGKFIKRTIDSVLSQDIEDLEYWIMDGNSTDNTVEILSTYPCEKIHFLSEPDQGQGNAVNKGIERLNVDIIGWLNSDDVYLPGALKMVVNYFATHPQCDVLFSKAQYLDEEDNHLGNYFTGKWTLDTLQKRCPIAQPAVFFRKSVWEKIGKINEELHYCLDYEYWIRISKAKANIAFLPTYLAAARLHAQTKTTNAGIASREEAMNMLFTQYGKIHPRWYFVYANSAILSLKENVSFFTKITKTFKIACTEAFKREKKTSAIIRLSFLGIGSVIAEIVARKLCHCPPLYTTTYHTMLKQKAL